MNNSNSKLCLLEDEIIIGRWKKSLSLCFIKCLKKAFNTIKGSVQRKIRWVKRSVFCGLLAREQGTGYNFCLYCSNSLSCFYHISISGQYWLINRKILDKRRSAAKRFPRFAYSFVPSYCANAMEQFCKSSLHRWSAANIYQKKSADIRLGTDYT